MVSGGSGAGGDAPKFLLREDHEGRFHADGALSDARTARAWLVKFPRSSHQDDRIVLRAERCYHRVATRMGVRTHGELEWQRDTLFIPRFDRVIGAVDGTSTVVRLGLESLCSLAGVAEFGAPIPKERLLTSLVAHATDPISEIRELVLRDLLDRALGNTDNHARNTAVLKHTDGHIALSPLYDFAPMFLDTQGIARVCRWDSERAGALDYGAWLETLAQAGLPNAKATLSTFAHRFAELRAIVREEDVPARVAQRCAPWIDRVTRELEALS